ncbi:MAG: NusA-like transcription termination signal-binding factor [Thermogladius sp.]
MSKERPQIKITPEEFRYMTLLHELTGVHVHDCVVDEENNRIIFLVKPDEIGKAIGPKGIFVQTLKKMLNKNIEIVGYSDNIEELTKYALAPARVREVKVAQRPGGKRVVYATVDPNDKAVAIGKNGKNVGRARLLLNRYFNIDTVIIA